MRPDLATAVKADLLEFLCEVEDPAVRDILLKIGMSRLLWTIDLIPEDRRAGDILQLGAEPYLLTLCLRRACSGPVTLVNYFGTDSRRGEQVLVNRRTGERLHLEYDLFNVETEDFPYPDASFDVVMFSEIIEHLALNPVRALSEIHRVLRPDGILVVTTPNCISLQRLEGYLKGQSEMVDRYSPGFGYGARHNREYRPYELQELLEHTGFVVEEMTIRDLVAVPRTQQLRRALWRRFLRWHSDHPREDHIFLRARRGPRFRWAFPQSLFDHIEFYLLVKYPWLEMGVNDSIQCAFGWSPLEIGSDGHGERRWTQGAGQALLRCPEDATAVRIECFAPARAGADALPVRVIVRHRWRWEMDPATIYADEVGGVERGAWRTLTIALPRRLPAGEEIEVNIAPDLAEGERGVAVRRVWFETAATGRAHG